MIRRILQLIFLPLFIPLKILYADILAIQSATILYTWYRNRKEFDEVGRTCEEDHSNKKTWEVWLEDAEDYQADCQKRNQPFLKIIVKPKPLLRWLNEQGLANNSGNREHYAQAVFQEICEAGIQTPRTFSKKKSQLTVFESTE
ncbi:hypothetical protein [Endozoicomonas sp.]|uniref:hypothetical protein n=1 Tax=Endozoicomonas sp. TaxID=1892382 RepID=UPI0028857E33|nr:hypothetical protein [Endozoicomonas sp.]